MRVHKNHNESKKAAELQGLLQSFAITSKAIHAKQKRSFSFCVTDHVGVCAEERKWLPAAPVSGHLTDLASTRQQMTLLQITTDCSASSNLATVAKAYKVLVG